jgi:outer membrane protein OmpA-like peptidoglycan-associated protein
MQFRKTLLLLLSFTLYAIAARSQGSEPILRKATIEYQALRYSSAIKELQDVMQKEPDNEKAIEMLAASNRHIKNYDEAVYWYGELTKLKHLKPEWALFYAEALRNKSRYEESEQWYRKYLSLKPADRRAKAFSTANMNAFANTGEWKVDYTNINSTAAEYSPMFFKDGLLFISNRQPKTRYTFHWDQTPYTDMYVIDHLDDIKAVEPKDSSEVAAAERVLAKSNADQPTSFLSLFASKKPKTVADEEGAVDAHPLRGKVKTTYHEGPAILLPEGSLMFTRNNYNGRVAQKSTTGINKLKIYTATGDNWDKITSFAYNNNEYSTGHPAISADGKILIFASDMPRGFGGTDLYYCVRTGDGKPWGRPVNLGAKINTEGDEQFPYLDKNGKLYFASTGLAGLGGLDIFEIVLKDMKAVGTPKNLGAEVNSPFDDFGLIVGEDGKSGFFSSNRQGNDDIFQFRRIAYAVKLKGVVLDSKTNRPVKGSIVLLRHNGIIDTIKTDMSGEFMRPLAKETDYEVAGRMPMYISNDAFVSSVGISTDTTLNVVLKLDKPQMSQQLVLNNCEALKKEYATESIYFDLDKSFIREDARRPLDALANLMIQHPEMYVITASHTDSRASEGYNKALSLRRGESAKAYLVSKGIKAGRIEVKYYGKSRLVTCPDGTICPESEQQKNRRTEFEVVLNGVNLNQLNCP